MLSELSNVSSTARSQKVGRPLGSTEAFKDFTKKNLIDGKNEITRRYAEVLRKNKTERVKKGLLNEIIENVQKKKGIKDKISPLVIRKRVQKNSLDNHHLAAGQILPL